MRKLSLTMPAGLLLASMAVEPAAAAVCLNVEDIANSHAARDGASITFTMTDGKIWRNDLKGKCPGLGFSGFAWSVQADQVCDNSQLLRVLESGEICALGKFTQVTSAPKG
jgi:hypothetical protein